MGLWGSTHYLETSALTILQARTISQYGIWNIWNCCNENLIYVIVIVNNYANKMSCIKIMFFVVVFFK